MIKALVEIQSLAPWFYPCLVFIYGAIIGSFLNVCILRIPEGRSIIRPGSQCSCGKSIAWYDNIPIFSWLILRGRARCCGRRFSFRYPAIELLTAALFLLVWLAFPPAKAACGMLMISMLICATFIDLDKMVIPDVFSVGLAAVGLILSALVPSLHGFNGDWYLLDSIRGLGASITGILVGSGLLLWIALVAEIILKKDAMGFGDVKFVGGLGAFLGWKGTLVCIFGGAVVGTLWFLIALILQLCAGRRAPKVIRAETPEGQETDLGLGVHVPFGPMLAIAGASYFLLLYKWVDPYFAQLAVLFR